MPLDFDIDDALWAGDLEQLDELAPCKCCCDEHTFSDCPARVWYHCRGQYNLQEEAEQWAIFYQRRGWSRDDFFRSGDDDGEA